MNPSLEKTFSVEGGMFDNAGAASIEIKRLLKQHHVSDAVVRRAAIAVYESELNIISYADAGSISLFLTEDAITIHVQDRGPGIEDIELAMQPGYSTASEEIRQMGFGAGMGLSNIEKCSDEFHISSELNRGTRLELSIKRDET